MASYTIDASVFVNGFNEREAGHEASLGFLSAARAAGAGLIAPALVLPEVAAAIARGSQAPDLALALISRLARLTSLILVPVDRGIAVEAGEIAAVHGLRGSDAVYGAVAARFASTLVTRDREQRERLDRVITVRSPEEAIPELKR